MRTQDRARVLIAAVALASACDRLPFFGDKDDPVQYADTDPIEPVVAEPPKHSVLPAVTDTDLPRLERARKRLGFMARGATHIGFNLDVLDGLHALAGAVEVPEWAASSEADVRAVRDDDLDTAWTCKPEHERPCAIGIHFPTAAEVKAVRLASAGFGKAYGEHARVTQVRLHTDAGYLDAEVPDVHEFTYVVLGKQVPTRSILVEVTKTTGGRDKNGLAIGDIEVYGLGGTVREPLTIDPVRTVIESDGKPWTRVRDEWVRAPSFLVAIGKDGKRTRLMPATAIYGAVGDRLLLVESFAATSCRRHEGLFYAFDRDTRLLAPLGALGGMGGEVFRQRDGLGFVHGYADDLVAHLSGVVLEGEAFKHRRTGRLSDTEGPQSFGQWNVDATPLARGGVPSNRPPEGCRLASDDALHPLVAIDAKADVARPGEWMICELGGSKRAFLTDHGPCGASWQITVLDDARVVASQGKKRKGARLRIRRIDDQRLWVELGDGSDDVELLEVGGTGISSLGELSLAALPPAACRQRCDDPFSNPTAPE